MYLYVVLVDKHSDTTGRSLFYMAWDNSMG